VRRDRKKLGIAGGCQGILEEWNGSYLHFVVFLPYCSRALYLMTSPLLWDSPGVLLRGLPPHLRLL
jgi:hypothetical protein